MNKKNTILFWDWKEDAPVDKIIKLGRKYKHYFYVPFDDANYCVFSDKPIKNEEEAWNVIEAE